MAEVQEVINLHGFSLKTNTLYEIQQKYDSSAPDGFKKYETTKALMDDIENQEVLAVFNEHMKVWDTGLYLRSPLLTHNIPDEDVRKIAIDKVSEYIITPLEQMRGEGALRNTSDNNDFWDGAFVSIFNGRVFNTSDPLQLLQLYLLLLRRVVTPKEQENSPHFLSSQYTIVDKESAVNKETEKASRMATAFGKYYELKLQNKEVLVSILNYLGINVKSTATDADLDLVFKRHIEDKNNAVININQFLEIMESYGSAKGKQLIGNYQKLKEMYNDNLIELRGKSIFMGDVNLGKSFKEAARLITEDKDLKKQFSELLK